MTSQPVVVHEHKRWNSPQETLRTNALNVPTNAFFDSWGLHPERLGQRSIGAELLCGGAKGLLGRGTKSLPKLNGSWANEVCCAMQPHVVPVQQVFSLLLLLLQRPLAAF